MAKLEQMRQYLSNAGCEERYINGFDNGAIWAYNELADFLPYFLSRTDYNYIDNNNIDSFLYSFRNHITNKETK